MIDLLQQWPYIGSEAQTRTPGMGLLYLTIFGYEFAVRPLVVRLIDWLAIREIRRHKRPIRRT